MSSVNKKQVNLVTALRAEARPIINHFRLRGVCQSPYHIFSSDDYLLRLIVSGIGKIISANATSYLRQYKETLEEASWLNVGIGGHRTLPVKSCVLAHTIIDTGANKSWSIPIAFSVPCNTASVRTVEQAEKEYPDDDVYDMEAAGFFSTARKFTKPGSVQVLKIISDNHFTPVETISSKKVTTFIDNNLETIVRIVDLLSRLSD